MYNVACGVRYGLAVHAGNGVGALRHSIQQKLLEKAKDTDLWSWWMKKMAFVCIYKNEDREKI